MRSISARRALTHPAWLAAAGVLLANDHLLKGAGLLPAIVTGKLSDFAGLFLAPALLSTIVRARSRRTVFAAHVLVAVVFTLVKVFPPATLAFEHLLSFFVPSRVWTDPTDLIALPAIVLAWRVLVPRMDDANRDGLRGTQTLAGAAGAIMCVATSQEVSQPLSIHNSARERITVTVRPLAAAVDFDEKVVFSSAQLPFTTALFDPAAGADVLSLEAGGTITSNDLGRRVVLVDVAANGKGSQFVVARSAPISAIDIAQTATGFSITSQGATIRDLARNMPCKGTPTVGPDYVLQSELRNASVVMSIGKPVLGCFDVDFANGQRAHACIPREAWPFDIGDKVWGDGSDIVGVVNNGDEIRIRVETTFDKSTPDLGCGWADTCGTIGFDTKVSVSSGSTELASGEDRTVGNVRYVAGRLQSIAVANTACHEAFPGKLGVRGSVIRIETQSVRGSDAGAD